MTTLGPWPTSAPGWTGCLSPSSWPLDGLASLIDKSLLRRIEGAGGEPRFGMLETIREYARRRLEEEGEAKATLHRHAEYFLDLADASEPYLTGPDQAPWLDRVEREHENLQAALRWSAERGDLDRALDAAASVWRVLGPPGGEARRRFDELGDERGVSKATADAAYVLMMQGDYASAVPVLQEASARSRRLGDMYRLTDDLTSLGQAHRMVGQHPEARAAFLEALDLFEEAGIPGGSGAVLYMMSALESDLGRHERALRLIGAAEGIREATGGGGRPALAIMMGDAVAVARAAIGDDQEKARRFYTEQLGLQVDTDAPYGPDERWITVVSPEEPGGIQLALHLRDQAAQDFQEANRKVGRPVVSFVTDDCRRDYEQLRAKGVSFISEPTGYPYGGTDAVFEDDCGNLLNLHQD